jgi:hypothetical protein
LAETNLEVDSNLQELARILIVPSLGRIEEARQRLETFTQNNQARQAYSIATIHGWRGDDDQAFHWLNRSVDQGEVAVVGTMTDPLLAGLRDDPRWDALLARMNLPISR